MTPCDTGQLQRTDWLTEEMTHSLWRKLDILLNGWAISDGFFKKKKILLNCFQNCSNWPLGPDHVTNELKEPRTQRFAHLLTELKDGALAADEEWALEDERHQEECHPQSFLYFIKAAAIWTEWRGQSMWPCAVCDDPFSHSISVLRSSLWQSEHALLE